MDISYDILPRVSPDRSPLPGWEPGAVQALLDAWAAQRLRDPSLAPFLDPEKISAGAPVLLDVARHLGVREAQVRAALGHLARARCPSYLPRWAPLTAPSRSFVQQFAQILRYLFVNSDGAADDPSLTATDTGGTSRAIRIRVGGTASILDAVGGAGAATHGILAGTGTATVSRADNALASAIADGTGAGQLSYGATTVTGPTAITGGYRVAVSRTLTNSSGGDITIQEIGLAITNFTTGFFFLLLRDLLSGGYALTAGDAVAARYRLDFTV